MSYQEENSGTGIPTRAIHEAYLDMQRALKQYRTANDRGDTAAVDSAHGDVQETVLTLYEMLRPHLKNNSAVAEYWDGKPPAYPTDGEQQAPDPEDGTAILAWQIHPQNYQLNGVDPSEPETLRDWHDELDVADTIRIHGLSVGDGRVFLRYQTYEMGLRHLDSWQTEFMHVERDAGGFMSGKKTPDTTRQRVSIKKLRRAARELSDVIDQLGLHASVKKSRRTYHAGGEDSEYPEPWGAAEKPE